MKFCIFFKKNFSFFKKGFYFFKNLQLFKMSQKLNCAPIFDGHCYNVLWTLGDKILFSNIFVDIFHMESDEQDAVFEPLCRTYPEDVVEFKGGISDVQQRQHGVKRLLFCSIEKFDFMMRELVNILNASRSPPSVPVFTIGSPSTNKSAQSTMPKSARTNMDTLNSALKTKEWEASWAEIGAHVASRRRAEFIEKVDELTEMVRTDKTVTQLAKRKRRDMTDVVTQLENLAK
jgi:hypothetical protein